MIDEVVKEICPKIFFFVKRESLGIWSDCVASSIQSSNLKHQYKRVDTF
jgi:hypothetical protein